MRPGSKKPGYDGRVTIGVSPDNPPTSKYGTRQITSRSHRKQKQQSLPDDHSSEETVGSSKPKHWNQVSDCQNDDNVGVSIINKIHHGQLCTGHGAPQIPSKSDGSNPPQHCLQPTPEHARISANTSTCQFHHAVHQATSVTKASNFNFVVTKREASTSRIFVPCSPSRLKSFETVYQSVARVSDLNMDLPPAQCSQSEQTVSTFGKDGVNMADSNANLKVPSDILQLNANYIDTDAFYVMVGMHHTNRKYQEKKRSSDAKNKPPRTGSRAGSAVIVNKLWQDIESFDRYDAAVDIPHTAQDDTQNLSMKPTNYKTGGRFVTVRQPSGRLSSFPCNMEMLTKMGVKSRSRILKICLEEGRREGNRPHTSATETVVHELHTGMYRKKAPRPSSAKTNIQRIKGRKRSSSKERTKLIAAEALERQQRAAEDNRNRERSLSKQTIPTRADSVPNSGLNAIEVPGSVRGSRVSASDRKQKDSSPKIQEEERKSSNNHLRFSSSTDNKESRSQSGLRMSGRASVSQSRSFALNECIRACHRDFNANSSVEPSLVIPNENGNVIATPTAKSTCPFRKGKHGMKRTKSKPVCGKRPAKPCLRRRSSNFLASNFSTRSGFPCTKQSPSKEGRHCPGTSPRSQCSKTCCPPCPQACPGVCPNVCPQPAGPPNQCPQQPACPPPISPPVQYQQQPVCPQTACPPYQCQQPTCPQPIGFENTPQQGPPASIPRPSVISSNNPVAYNNGMVFNTPVCPQQPAGTPVNACPPPVACPPSPVCPASIVCPPQSVCPPPPVCPPQIVPTGGQDQPRLSIPQVTSQRPSTVPDSSIPPVATQPPCPVAKCTRSTSTIPAKPTRSRKPSNLRTTGTCTPSSTAVHKPSERPATSNPLPKYFRPKTRPEPKRKKAKKRGAACDTQMIHCLVEALRQNHTFGQCYNPTVNSAPQGTNHPVAPPPWNYQPASGRAQPRPHNAPMPRCPPPVHLPQQTVLCICPLPAPPLQPPCQTMPQAGTHPVQQPPQCPRQPVAPQLMPQPSRQSVVPTGANQAGQRPSSQIGPKFSRVPSRSIPRTSQPTVQAGPKASTSLPPKTTGTQPIVIQSATGTQYDPQDDKNVETSPSTVTVSIGVNLGPCGGKAVILPPKIQSSAQADNSNPQVPSNYQFERP